MATIVETWGAILMAPLTGAVGYMIKRSSDQNKRLTDVEKTQAVMSESLKAIQASNERQEDGIDRIMDHLMPSGGHYHGQNPR